jgi:uncharacterized membrane protein YfcA
MSPSPSRGLWRITMEEFDWWWSKKNHEKWRSWRKMGPGGVILFFVGVMLLSRLVASFLPGKYRTPLPKDLESWGVFIIGILFIGMLVGSIAWALSERNFHRHEPDPPEPQK